MHQPFFIHYFITKYKLMISNPFQLQVATYKIIKMTIYWLF